MKLIALSGSVRQQSTNTALLEAIERRSPDGVSISLYRDMESLPIFNPDREGDHTPSKAGAFIKDVTASDGLILACPEYAHGIPGGFKNALDWLVSSVCFPDTPIMICHASHRGEFVLNALKEVLKTMSADIVEEAYLQIPLMSKTPDDIRQIAAIRDTNLLIRQKVHTFVSYIKARRRKALPAQSD